MYMIPHSSDDNWFTNGFADSDFSVLSWRDMYTQQMLSTEIPLLPFELSTELPQQPYVFPIRTDLLNRTPDKDRADFLNQLVFTIPETVLADVRNNRCKILFDNSMENYNIITSTQLSFVSEIIKRTVQHYQLEKSQVILITGNYCSADSDVYTVAIRNWSDSLIVPATEEYFNQQKELILNKQVRPKKLLTFMRKERHYRFRLAYYIHKHNLRQDNIVTFGKNVNQTMWNYIEKTYADLDDFLTSLPWHYDVELHSLHSLDAVLAHSPAEQQAYLNTYINCVAEMAIKPEQHELDISEKTFKPIAFLQPFFVFGQPGTLSYLHQQGYKTFDQWWDESYDRVDDPGAKFNMLTALYKKLSKTSHSELADILYHMWPTLEHNYYTYQNHVRLGNSYNNLLKTINQCFDK